MKHPFRTLIVQSVLLTLLVLSTRLFVAVGWLQPVKVVGESMTPSLQPGQELLVRRWAPPERWDAVVLRSPEDARHLLIKRVLGLPGESISFHDGDLWINGQPAARNPKSPGGVSYGAMGNPVWQLGPDEWFVVGDNPLVSIDSRNWDAAAGVPSRLIVGVVAE